MVLKEAKFCLRVDMNKPKTNLSSCMKLSPCCRPTSPMLLTTGAELDKMI